MKEALINITLLLCLAGVSIVITVLSLWVQVMVVVYVLQWMGVMQ